jgi:hypothetical protein
VPSAVSVGIQYIQEFAYGSGSSRDTGIRHGFTYEAVMIGVVDMADCLRLPYTATAAVRAYKHSRYVRRFTDRSVPRCRSSRCSPLVRQEKGKVTVKYIYQGIECMKDRYRRPVHVFGEEDLQIGTV